LHGILTVNIIKKESEMKLLTLLQAERQSIGDPSLGIIIPGVVLLISIILTWMLYKHFSKQ